MKQNTTRPFFRIRLNSSLTLSTCLHTQSLGEWRNGQCPISMLEITMGLLFLNSLGKKAAINLVLLKTSTLFMNVLCNQSITGWVLTPSTPTAWARGTEDTTHVMRPSNRLLGNHTRKTKAMQLWKHTGHQPGADLLRFPGHAQNSLPTNREHVASLGLREVPSRERVRKDRFLTKRLRLSYICSKKKKSIF